MPSTASPFESPKLREIGATAYQFLVATAHFARDPELTAAVEAVRTAIDKFLDPAVLDRTIEIFQAKQIKVRSQFPDELCAAVIVTELAPAGVGWDDAIAQAHGVHPALTLAQLDAKRAQKRDQKHADAKLKKAVDLEGKAAKQRQAAEELARAAAKLRSEAGGAATQGASAPTAPTETQEKTEPASAPPSLPAAPAEPHFRMKGLRPAATVAGVLWALETFGALSANGIVNKLYNDGVRLRGVKMTWQSAQWALDRARAGLEQDSALRIDNEGLFFWLSKYRDGRWQRWAGESEPRAIALARRLQELRGDAAETSVADLAARVGARTSDHLFLAACERLGVLVAAPKYGAGGALRWDTPSI